MMRRRRSCFFVIGFEPPNDMKTVREAYPAAERGSTRMTSLYRLTLRREPTIVHRLFSHPTMLRHQLLAIAQRAQSVDRGEIRQRGRFENIRAQPAAADFAVVVLQLDLHLTQRFLSLGDGADAVVAEGDLDPGQPLDRGVDGVDGAITNAGVLDRLAIAVLERDRGGGDGVGARGYLKSR